LRGQNYEKEGRLAGKDDKMNRNRKRKKRVFIYK